MGIFCTSWETSFFSDDASQVNHMLRDNRRIYFGLLPYLRGLHYRLLWNANESPLNIMLHPFHLWKRHPISTTWNSGLGCPRGQHLLQVEMMAGYATVCGPVTACRCFVKHGSISQCCTDAKCRPRHPSFSHSIPSFLSLLCFTFPPLHSSCRDAVFTRSTAFVTQPSQLYKIQQR